MNSMFFMSYIIINVCKKWHVLFKLKIFNKILTNTRKHFNIIISHLESNFLLNTIEFYTRMIL